VYHKRQRKSTSGGWNSRLCPYRENISEKKISKATEPTTHTNLITRFHLERKEDVSGRLQFGSYRFAALSPTERALSDHLRQHARCQKFAT